MQAEDWRRGIVDASTHLGSSGSLTLAQAAKVLHLSSSTLRWQIHNRKLAATKLGSMWVVDVADVMRYRQEHQRSVDL